MIKGFPCYVTAASFSKPGKHGSAKVILKGIDPVTQLTYECVLHAGELVDVVDLPEEEPSNEEEEAKPIQNLTQFLQ